MSIFKVGDRVRITKKDSAHCGREAIIVSELRKGYMEYRGQFTKQSYDVHEVDVVGFGRITPSGVKRGYEPCDLEPILRRPELSAMTYEELMLSLSWEPKIVSIAELLRETCKVVSV